MRKTAAFAGTGPPLASQWRDIFERGEPSAATRKPRKLSAGQLRRRESAKKSRAGFGLGATPTARGETVSHHDDQLFRVRHPDRSRAVPLASALLTASANTFSVASKQAPSPGPSDSLDRARRWECTLDRGRCPRRCNPSSRAGTRLRIRSAPRSSSDRAEADRRRRHCHRRRRRRRRRQKEVTRAGAATKAAWEPSTIRWPRAIRRSSMGHCSWTTRRTRRRTRRARSMRGA